MKTLKSSLSRVFYAQSKTNKSKKTHGSPKLHVEELESRQAPGNFTGALLFGISLSSEAMLNAKAQEAVFENEEFGSEQKPKQDLAGISLLNDDLTLIDFTTIEPSIPSQTVENYSATVENNFGKGTFDPFAKESEESLNWLNLFGTNQPFQSAQEPSGASALSGSSVSSGSPSLPSVPNAIAPFSSGFSKNQSPSLQTGSQQFNSSLLGRFTASAYVASVFPDGRIMDDGNTTPPVAPGEGSSDMVISQVYSEGGQTNSEYRQDYIELFNRGDASVDLSGWSLQYAAAGSGTWQVVSLSGTVAPGQYHLIQGVTGSEGLNDIPTADTTSGIDFAIDGKVALVNSTTPLSGTAPTDSSIVDFVGYGQADAFEGNGAALAGDLTSATMRVNGGYEDTDDNSYDFNIELAAPKTSASPIANRPPVNAVPDSQTTPLNTALTFSTANGNAFSVSDPDANGSDIEISLSATDGDLTLFSTNGLTFTVGDGTTDAEMTFSGTINDINIALDGMSFNPSTGFEGPAVIAIIADDLGNTGAGEAQFDLDTVLIAVGGPLITVDDYFATYEDTDTDIDVLANDAFVHGDQLALSIQSGPTYGIATVNDNGTTETYDDFINYLPNSDFYGTDTFTYSVYDGYGNNATGTVTMDVESINDAELLLPVDQANQEGDYVDLELNLTNYQSMEFASFNATGLPDGLWIDSYTGTIYGQITHTAAETNNGVYQVNVDVTVGSDTDSQSFEWIVNHTNLLGWIDDQVHGENESVSVFVNYEYGLANGDSPTYSATGLPDGLWIDENTGEIYGMVQAQAPGITQFTTTVTATDSSGVHNQTFTWNILSGTDPIVMFAINDTYTNIDDVTLVNPQLPLDVGVKLYAPNTSGSQVIDLQVPSGLSSLNVSSISLAHGQTGTVTLTPLQVSAVDDDVVLLAFMGGQQVGQGKGVNLDKIEILTNDDVGKISAANTPSGMPDRIPPRVDTEYQVKYYGANTTKEFKLKVLNQSNNNGEVKLWSNANSKYFGGVDFTMPQYPANYTPVGNAKLYTGQLNGTAQTKPGNAGKLKVAIFHATENNLTEANAIVVSEANGFSVAAIPTKVEMHSPIQTDGTKDVGDKDYIWVSFGTIYKLKIYSDSGILSDLDKVWIKEKAVPDVTTATGVGKLVTYVYLGGKFPPASDKGKVIVTDTHAIGPNFKRTEVRTVAKARKLIFDGYKTALDNQKVNPGKVDIYQYLIFWDERTGMVEGNAVKVKESGFKIETLYKKNENKYLYVVTKTPHANNGVEKGIMPVAAQATFEQEIKP